MRIESRVASPIVPLGLFRSESFSGANLLTLFLYAALGIFFFVLPLNLIQVQGYSATAAGGAILPLILINFLLSRWSGGLVQRYGARTPLIVGTAITTAGISAVLAARHRRQLLDDVLSRHRRNRVGHGGQCRPADDGSDGRGGR